MTQTALRPPSPTGGIVRYVAVSVAVVIVALSSASVVAGQKQDAEPQFEVASVKRTVPPNQERSGIIPTPGRFTAEKATASLLIAFAYTGAMDEMRGEPPWSHSDYYDVMAPLPSGTTRPETSLMVRSLLRERFHLAAHIEQEQREVLALVRVRPDGPLPSGFVRVDVDCDGPAAAGQPPAPLDQNGDVVPCRGMFNGREYRSGGLPVRVIANQVSGAVGKKVVDETGLSGSFRFVLRYSSNEAPTDQYPDIITALREQLGLKLVPKKATVNVLIIDHIERPTEN